MSERSVAPEPCVPCITLDSAHMLGFWGGSAVRNPPAVQEKQETQETWVGKTPWRAWQPTPVFLPGESHGQRSLVGYSPRARKESDTTEATGHEPEHTHYHSATTHPQQTLLINPSIQQSSPDSTSEGPRLLCGLVLPGEILLPFPPLA